MAQQHDADGVHVPVILYVPTNASRSATVVAVSTGRTMAGAVMAVEAVEAAAEVVVENSKAVVECGSTEFK